MKTHASNRSLRRKGSGLLVGPLSALLGFGPVPAYADIPPTPSPTYSFATGTGSTTRINIGGSPADANIAVSGTHICLTARAAFACYTKGGTLVKLGAGFQARPYTATEFFTQSGINVLPATSGTDTKDGRIVFERYSKRFFTVFQGRSQPPQLLIAVSKSEDPRDGWWTYADNVQDGEINGHDYMWMGVTAGQLLVSSIMWKCVWDGPNWDCKTYRAATIRTRHFMYPVSALVSGQPYARGEWMHSAAHMAVPCVNASYSTDAFWVHRDDDTHVSVWRYSGQFARVQVTIGSSGPSPAAVDGVQLGGAPVSFTNIGIHPQNCQYRSGRIVWASNQGHTWSGQSSSNNAVRLGRLNVSSWPSVTVEIDRIFGRASAGDSVRAIYDYGWPAVAANANGDIVIGSVRSNSTIYPELRGTAWFSGQPDISSSVSLRTSSSPLSQFHMAGAAADPTTSGIYLAQQFGATSPSWRIHVVKLFGVVKPDVIATQVQPPGLIAPGSSGNVTVTVMNQGDGQMSASLGELYLSTNNTIEVPGPDVDSDTLLTSFSVPVLAPNQVATLVVPFTVAPTQPLGNYFVGVALDRTKAVSEHSETNNQNPFKYGNRGNAPMTVFVLRFP
jgi:hypothetical protein